MSTECERYGGGLKELGRTYGIDKCLIRASLLSLIPAIGGFQSESYLEDPYIYDLVISSKNLWLAETHSQYIIDSEIISRLEMAQINTCGWHIFLCNTMLAVPPIFFPFYHSTSNIVLNFYGCQFNYWNTSKKEPRKCRRAYYVPTKIGNGMRSRSSGKPNLPYYDSTTFFQLHSNLTNLSVSMGSMIQLRPFIHGQ